MFVSREGRPEDQFPGEERAGEYARRDVEPPAGEDRGRVRFAGLTQRCTRRRGDWHASKERIFAASGWTSIDDRLATSRCRRHWAGSAERGAQHGVVDGRIAVVDLLAESSKTWTRLNSASIGSLNAA